MTKLSAAEQWRQQRQRWVSLPCGLEAHVRPVSLASLAERGEVPAPLAGVAHRFLEQQVLHANEMESLTAEEYQRFVRVINLVVRTCVLALRIPGNNEEFGIADDGAEPADNEIRIDEIPLMPDRVAVWNNANWGADTLRPLSGQSRARSS